MSSSTNRRRGALLALLTGAAVLLVLAGCSGGSEDGGGQEAVAEAETATTAADSETSAGTTSSSPEEPVVDDTLTVGWIFAAADSADSVPALESAFEGQVESVVEENAAGDPAAAAEALVSQGAELVLSEVAGACDAVSDAPCIEPGGAGVPAPNGVTLDTDFWMRAYLLGRAAGLLTETDNIGFLAAEDSPAQKGTVNAFALGCQGSNNNCQIRLAIAPESVKRALQGLRSSDVDLIAATLFNPALCNAAGDVVAVQPVLAPGDPCGNAYAVASLAAAAEPLVRAVLDGSWQGGRSELLPLGEWADSVAEEVRQSVEARATEIEQGRNVFVGPLFDNAGTEQVADGEELTPEFIASQWDWLLGGVFEQSG